MASTPRGTVRWWRWRRNPLRRRSDVVETWAVLVAWALAVAGGLLAGLVTAVTVERGLDRERAERQGVSAVVTKDAVDEVSARPDGNRRAWAPVRWVAPDGWSHTDRTRHPDPAPGQAPGSPSGPTGAEVWPPRRCPPRMRPSAR
ncbi:Rv1733c family protein [Streptomyces sp. NBC_00285]|uniref:Rv1733c family protein n=1 Tax=Streptomyces sp. NBC_00285 TaxID=2975700 RepID=UPI002E2D1983|nr:hypothetical protein [Streptomyces sp. NBC_00285]